MARPSKLTPDITRRIGDGVSLGLTYALAAESSGITYKTFNEWMNKGKIEKSGKSFHFYQPLFYNRGEVKLNGIFIKVFVIFYFVDDLKSKYFDYK